MAWLYRKHNLHKLNGIKHLGNNNDRVVNHNYINIIAYEDIRSLSVEFPHFISFLLIYLIFKVQLKPIVMQNVDKNNDCYANACGRRNLFGKSNEFGRSSLSPTGITVFPVEYAKRFSLKVKAGLSYLVETLSIFYEIYIIFTK